MCERTLVERFIHELEALGRLFHREQIMIKIHWCRDVTVEYKERYKGDRLYVKAEKVFMVKYVKQKKGKPPIYYLRIFTYPLEQEYLGRVPELALLEQYCLEQLGVE
jgi:hypothetical protein